MHRSLAILLTITALGCQTAQAGVVLFDPPEITIDPSTGPTTGAFTVTVVSDQALIDNIKLILASEDVALTGFDYEPAMLFAFGPFAVSPQLFGLWPHDLVVGGFSASGAIRSPLVLGTLEVDASGLSPGDYELFSDPVCFSCTFPLPEPPESFSGAALVHVIPEPTSIGLLLIGCAAVGGWKRHTRRNCEATQARQR